MRWNSLGVMVSVVGLSAAGCGDDPMVVADAGRDASAIADSGDEVRDTGTPIDAFSTVDAFSADDAFVAADAFSESDAALDAAVIPPGDTYGLTSTGRLASFDRATGEVRTVETITGIGAGETIVGIDVRPRTGALYALTKDASNAGRLYTVAVPSGVASSPQTLSVALAGTRFGIDFNPAADALRIVSDTGQNLRVNVTTAVATVDGTLNPATTTVASAAYTNSHDDTCRTQLFVIDTASDRLRLQNPPNAGTLTDVGTGLGLDASEAVGFDVVTTVGADMRLRNAAIATLTVGLTTQLYDIDLTTGMASGARAITGLLPSESLLDVAAPTPAADAAIVQDVGEYWGVTEDGRMVSFNRAAPRNFCTTSTLTGMLAGESIVGLDTRPATIPGQAKLYGIGRVDASATGGRLLSFDVTDPRAIVASGSALISPASGVAFGGLTATAYAVDFNPAADLLRVIGDNGQNLRIVPPGRLSITPVVLDPAYTTFTDATINDAATPPVTVLGLSAAAYDNADEDGTTPTTLYALDTNLDRLVRIGGAPGAGGACPATVANPNCGVVTEIGGFALASGLDLTAEASFDIGGATNSAVAVVRDSSATVSSIYDVNLTTGALTTPSGIGSNDPVGTTNRIVALARRVVP